MNKWIKALIIIVAVCICIILIITGQQTIGWRHLLVQLAGLAGLLVLLFLYNKKYQ